MWKYVSCVLVGILVSLQLYSFPFTFMPSLNTKMILAPLGVLLFAYDAIKKQEIIFSKSLWGAIGLATLFSLICYFATDYNGWDDFSYANYIASMLTWLFSAYTSVWFIRLRHGTVNLRLLTTYLAVISAFHSVFALVIDRNESIKAIVDSIQYWQEDFMDQIGRIYSLGVALDPAGVRFSIVLVLIATIVKHEKVRQNSLHLAILLLCFILIIGLGNIISRTTTVGAVFALFILFSSTGIHQLVVRAHSVKMMTYLAIGLLILVPISVYLYQTDESFYNNFRFAFEGFFNWAERGEWTTASTEKLDNTMWIWPTDFKTWMIGTGRFGDFAFGTDIGYCRFILYCGLIGFSVLTFYMLYHPLVLYRRFRRYSLMFLALAVMQFVIWVKVATDIFLIYALIYWISREDEEADWTEEETEVMIEEHEDSLLHSGNV